MGVDRHSFQDFIHVLSPHMADNMLKKNARFSRNQPARRHNCVDSIFLISLTVWKNALKFSLAQFGSRQPFR